MYEGAVRRKLTVEHQDAAEPDENASQGSDFQRGQSMSMGEALSRSKGNDIAVLDSLNRDSKNAGLGDLFEYETG